MWARQRATAVLLKRVYEEPSDDDGTRVLVERLWPRGITKERARIDQWLKEVAPTAELRRWYGHREERWPEFRRRYEEELRTREEARAALDALRALGRVGPLTLVFAAKDAAHCSAHVVADVLKAED
jgi:uncharacterized protein YeaO (DUF488 family)